MVYQINTSYSVNHASEPTLNRLSNPARAGKPVITSSGMFNIRNLVNTAKIVTLYMLAIQAPISRIPRAQAEPLGTAIHPEAKVPVRVDAQGEFIKDSYGNMVVLDTSKQMPVIDQSTGMPTVIDPGTSAVTVFRRSSLPNDLPSDMIKSALQNGGTESKNPALIREELFNEYGVVDPGKLEKAMKNYAAEDIYMALIEASRFSSWDRANGLEELLSKTPQGHGLLARLALKWNDVRIPDRREATLILVSILAFSRQNAPYASTKNGEAPVVLLTAKSPAGGLAASSESWQTAFVPNTFSDNEIVAMAFHEFCHLHQSADMKAALSQAVQNQPMLSEFNDEKRFSSFA